MKDFFISYTKADEDWAAWIAWKLELHGSEVILQAWDFPPGTNFVIAMQQATVDAGRTIAIFSANYLERAFPQSEWAAAFASDPTSKDRKLLPIRVQHCELKGLLAQIVYVDLVDLDEEAAESALLEAVQLTRRKPLVAPRFPATVRAPDFKAFPGASSGAPTDGSGPLSIVRNFVHTRIGPSDGLVLERLANPYNPPSDATDPAGLSAVSSVTASIWLPVTEYLRHAEIQLFTPVTAICVPSTEVVMRRFQHATRNMGQRALHLPPRKMRNEEKERLLTAIGLSLPDSFVISVTVPSLVLAIGKTRPDMAYEALVNLFVLPLVALHRRLGVESLAIRMTHVADESASLLKFTKRAVKAVYGKTRLSDVELVSRDDDAMLGMARLISWAVGTMHNAGTVRWIRLLEKAFLDGTGSSRLEEPVPESTSHAL
jgi:hypothetical protein